MSNLTYSDDVWQNPLCLPSLDNDQVHIWRANLNLSNVAIQHLATFLSNDEIARANKFYFPEHKRRFIVARGILRQLLSNYLNISPKKIEFDYGDRGKPQLSKSSNNSLQFNVSHSQEYALFGFASDRLIGVDIEYLREMPDAIKIARRFFSPPEFQLIASLDDQQQQKVFFKLWTAKEAYLKALGTGLAGSLNSIEISFEDDNLLITEGTAILDNWFICSYIPADNYVAAMAIDKKITKQQIRFWNAPAKFTGR